MYGMSTSTLRDGVVESFYQGFCRKVHLPGLHSFSNWFYRGYMGHRCALTARLAALHIKPSTLHAQALNPRCSLDSSPELVNEALRSVADSEAEAA